MGALLGVGQGAFHEPPLIAVKLPGWAKWRRPAPAIVGKGVASTRRHHPPAPSGMEEMTMTMGGRGHRRRRDQRRLRRRRR